MKKELCVRLVIYKNYTEMHGQQNIKKKLAILFGRTVLFAILGSKCIRSYGIAKCLFNSLNHTACLK
jgi:hypothetical protein